MSNYPEYKLVQKCLRYIESQLGWGDAAKWHNDVFIELSDKIQQKTQVLLSPTTLKRVWGKVAYKNAPSISTLNTLAQFAGFHNWRDFKNSQSQRKPSFLRRRISPNLGVIMGSAALMTLLFISLYSLTGKKEVVPPDYSKLQFSSRPIAKGLPNSVVFDFDLTGVQSDSLLIQQYWDPTKTIKIKRDQKQATGQYYYPGYFRAKLLIDGEIIKEHDLFIKTDNWMGTIDYEPIPKYIPTSDVLGNGLSLSKVYRQEVMASDKPLQTAYHFVNEFPTVSGDNFIIETALRHTYSEKWAVCQKSAIVVIGTKSAYVIPFAIAGCVSEIGIMMSDVYLSGKEHDLSPLGADFSQFRDIKIETQSKRVRIAIDGNEVFSKKYEESIGNVVGIRFRFIGAGEVAYLRLRDQNGTNAFGENFKPLP